MSNNPFDGVSDNYDATKEFAFSCDGWKTSDCCGAKIISHDICFNCKEHCENQCAGCEGRITCVNFGILNKK
jgi:hypothetical protein